MNFQVIDALEDGFFAERVIKTIRENGKNDESKRELLKLVVKYIDRIEEGKSRKTGKRVSDPVESLVAYRKALDIIAALPCDEEINESRIKQVLGDVKKEVSNAIKQDLINPEHLKKTFEYFQGARRLAIQEITSESMQRQEPTTWQPLT